MRRAKQILIVDDEVSMRKNLVDLLSSRGYSVLEAGDGPEALKHVADHRFDLILLDLNLPGMDGITVLGEIRNSQPDLPVIIFTAYGTSERAIRAMKAGAYDYMEKPFELDEFMLIVQRAAEYSELLSEVRELRSKVSTITDKSSVQIIGSSAPMKDIFKLIGRVSATDATVLIQGGSGTGKELIADAIQRHSLRSEKPYVKVHCGAFSESVLESEIFGHEKGAFTGAISQHQGRFELADGGTIFLDEINTMSPALQVRLLRVLQDKMFYRVGGETSVRVDVRVIAAANSDVGEEVRKGRFREDLFYRLNVVQLNIPPLAERREDIPLLVRHFLQKYSPERDLVVTEKDLQTLQSYSWPGNVRELENTIQSAIVLARENMVSIGQLPAPSRGGNAQLHPEKQLENGMSLKDILAKTEENLIRTALIRTNYNRTKAAGYLGIHRRLLYTKMQEYGISE
ncbi:MAG: sigma-54-dependent Fis family transcriptional regulator [bacterium]|nr:sigma-54-dependent Fis family transcriptional regulator [bacterium]